MSMIFKLFILAVLSLFLTACQSAVVQPETTPTSKEITQPSYLTAEPTDLLIPAATNSPVPTDTFTPSSTSPLPTATPDWTEFELEAWMSASPDGIWVAKIVVAYPPMDASGALSGDAYHAQVRVHSIGDANIGWTVVDEWLNIGLGMTRPTVLRWTQDGGALFVADSGVPDGCGSSFIVNVRRVDLKSGQVNALDEGLFGKLSVSPDGETLISFSRNTGLVVHGLNTAAVNEIAFAKPEGDWWPGGIVWSPDGREFLFDLSTDPCFTPEEVYSSIWIASLESGEARPLIRDDPRRLSVVSWPSGCLAQVSGSDDMSWLNPCTGEFNQMPSAEIIQARDALTSFFEALHEGRYADAVKFYGGSYDSLRDINPSIDTEDYAALWSSACQFNGFVCLPVGSYVLESQGDPDVSQFSVTFDQEGETFFLGPCCGTSVIDQPPVRQFTYTVVKDPTGAYRVQELPVFMP